MSSESIDSVTVIYTWTTEGRPNEVNCSIAPDSGIELVTNFTVDCVGLNADIGDANFTLFAIHDNETGACV